MCGRDTVTAVGDRLATAAAALAATVVAAGCGGSEEARSPTVEGCLRDLPADVAAALPPTHAAHVSFERLDRAAEPLCRAIVQEQRAGAASSERDAVDFVRAISRDRPALWRPVCEVVIDAELRSLGPKLRAVSKADRARYRRGVCRVGVRYLRADGSLDVGRLARKHRGLYVPFCAVDIRQALDRDPGAQEAFTRAQRQTIATRSCDAAIREGALDFGMLTPAGEPELDEVAFQRIVDRVAADVLRSSRRVP
jgi:hypothetical protein